MTEAVYSAILGLIQGLTELLPISSSGHLIVFPYLAGFKDPGLSLSVFLHTGTLIALLIYFWKDIVNLFANRNWRLIGLIVISVIPAGLGGYFLDQYAQTMFRSPLIVGLNLIVFGFVLYWADRVKKEKSLDQIGLREAIIIGLSQVLALVPGVSRSGITISTGMFLGQKRSSSARYSFLILIPTLIGASLLKGVGYFQSIGSSSQPGLSTIVIGLIVSLVFSYLALVLLFRLLKKVGYWPFVVYRLILGAIVLAIYFFS